jgi:uncharacterized protein
MKHVQLLSLAYPAFILLVLAQYSISTGLDAWLTPDTAAYEAEINQWHQQRIESLRSENGWLNLAGLFWLKEGKNTFGSARSNDLVFPDGKIPAQAGNLVLHNGEVLAEAATGVEIFAGTSAEPIRRVEILSKTDEAPVTLRFGSLRWFVIKRGDEYGIRLRDLESPRLQAFTGIERYPVDAALRVEARLVPHPVPTDIPITNVLGQTTPTPSPGTLVFRLNGREYRLDAVGEGEQLFILFADATNGEDTYGAGRFLYAAKPGQDGKVVLDFNKSFNPPCAFTPYATCPLPPKQNVLPLAVKAGEKAYLDPMH